MVRPIKLNCCNGLRTRAETTASKRAENQVTGDKESKLTTIRTNIKHESHHHHQRDVAIECEL